MIKRILPYSVKVKIQLFRRSIIDVRNGHYFIYAKKRPYSGNFPNVLSIDQDLKPNEAKLKNLLIAIKYIESIQIEPNEIFSFWQIVGSPSSKRGFVHSRSIINGDVSESIGGGLCQLSGLIYYISLYAKLEILERHSHSMDIYTDETRFAPLGSDATVVYGYKDLKIINNLSSPIRFRFSIKEKNIQISLLHACSLEENTVEFKKNELDNQNIEVTTLINNKPINRSKYKRAVPFENSSQ